ncbi:DUF1499 domain-containing protein [Thioclava sp. FR2]|uniref:DUF1499 domain-containing protein n=1 Tax=Thioclava sp. FR2 TaxID=3445780 RepID=UPI003EB8D84E
MSLFIAFALIAAMGLMAAIRLAPSDPAVWHDQEAIFQWADDAGPWNDIVPLTGGATLRLSLAKGAPADLLSRLDVIAGAAPRTERLAGSIEDGRITWITRSALWGFPDYTSAETREDGLYVYARLRFGRDDFGVNAARLSDWLARL